MKALVRVVLILGILGGGVWWFFFRTGRDGAAEVRYRTAAVDRGEVIEGIAANGTVEPVELVQVGTQISGTIERLFVDFNSRVKAGERIALLDSRRLAAQVAQDEAAVAKARADAERVVAAQAEAEATLERAKTSVVQAEAEVGRVQALLVQAKADLDRQKSLVERRLTAPSDVDAAQALEGSLQAQLASANAAVLGSKAQVAVGEASVAQAKAQVSVSKAAVDQASAQLEGDRVNLGYATILSPVDGVVVSRSVDVGQTVAASLQAPTLFTIARDLTKVQVETSVPEADIGRVKEKQPASFTVDAYPGRSFPASVSQVRLASTTVQNVVTYVVVVGASNPDGLLFPGMTATVTFEISRSAKDALRVPATALRLNPAPELVVETPPDPAADAEGPARGRASSDASGGDRPAGDRPPKGSGGRSRRGRAAVYVQAPGNRLRAVAVRAGISDGAFTVVEPVVPDSLPEGTLVVTAVLKDAEGSATTNPFAPQMGRGRR